MKKEQITCDGCGKDLTASGEWDCWTFVLTDEPLPKRAGTALVGAQRRTSVLPNGQVHACSLDCLRLAMATVDGRPATPLDESFAMLVNLTRHLEAPADKESQYAKDYERAKRLIRRTFGQKE